MDVILIISKDQGKIKVLKRELAAKFEIKDLGSANYFVRVRITRNRAEGTISLCQDAYVEKVLKRFSM